jgi:hypothetical protein
MGRRLHAAGGMATAQSVTAALCQKRAFLMFPNWGKHSLHLTETIRNFSNFRLFLNMYLMQLLQSAMTARIENRSDVSAVNPTLNG